jgi:diaminopimelate epimerase
MIFSFEKYHGAGNDFILIDNRNGSFRGSKELINQLCHRRLGVGSDGLMLLEIAPGYDFGMRYYNSDGGEGSMCGNGGRCITSFARHLGLIEESARFSAVDGVHHAQILSYRKGQSSVKLKMQDVAHINQHPDYFFIDTGSPHHIIFVSNLADFDVVGEGKKIRYSAAYPQGTNVDFVEIRSNEIHMRTYERGVEDETLSCGTGAVAVALAFRQLHPERESVQIHTPGGILNVSSTRQQTGFTNLFLEGPVVHVFSGTFDTQTFTQSPA